ncbi:MAG: hypothetical protein JXR05_07025 [Flavobacteriaceae bacterium]
MKKRIAFILLVLLTLNLHSQTKKEVYKKDNYSIEYPTDWKFDNSGFRGTSFTITSSVSTEGDKFGENINMIIQDLTAYDLDLDEYVLLSKNQFSTGVPGSKFIKDERSKNKDYEYHTIVVEADMNNFSLKMKQVYIIKNKKAYVLTFTAEKSQYENYIKVGDEILNSFKFIK